MPAPSKTGMDNSVLNSMPKPSGNSIDTGGMAKNGMANTILNSMPEPTLNDGMQSDSVLNSMPNHTKKYAPKPANVREKGTADTDTKGAFNCRYVHYRNLVSKGDLNPTVNAFRKVDYKGKKLGTTTAQEFLRAMVSDGLLIKEKDGNDRTVYNLKGVNNGI